MKAVHRWNKLDRILGCTEANVTQGHAGTFQNLILAQSLGLTDVQRLFCHALNGTKMPQDNSRETTL